MDKFSKVNLMLNSVIKVYNKYKNQIEISLENLITNCQL